MKTTKNPAVPTAEMLKEWATERRPVNSLKSASNIHQ